MEDCIELAHRVARARWLLLGGGRKQHRPGATGGQLTLDQFGQCNRRSLAVWHIAWLTLGSAKPGTHHPGVRRPGGGELGLVPGPALDARAAVVGISGQQRGAQPTNGGADGQLRRLQPAAGSRDLCRQLRGAHYLGGELRLELREEPPFTGRLCRGSPAQRQRRPGPADHLIHLHDLPDDLPNRL